MNEEERYLLIERYIAGELSESEEATVNEYLEKDQIWVDAHDRHLTAHKLMEIAGGTLLKKKLQTADKLNPINTSVRPFWQRGYSIAAILVLLIGIAVAFFMRQQYSNKGIMNQYAEAYSAGAIRGGEEAADEMEWGMRAYAKGDFDAAQKFLSTILPTDNRYIEAQFFLGNTWLKLEDPTAAKSAFQLVDQAGDARFGKASEWYLFLSFIGTGEIDEAKELGQKLIDQPNHPYKNKIQEVLASLESIWR